MGNKAAEGPDLESLWQETLEGLRLQMAGDSFYTWLQPTKLVAVEEGQVYVVETDSEPAQAWLEKRLRPLIERTLASVVGQAVHLKVVRRCAEVTLPPVEPFPELQAVGRPPALHGLEGTLARKIDFEALWQKTGFTAFPDYALRFWRIYLGRAFDLWEVLVSDDKRNVRAIREGTLSYWTPARRYSYHGLARCLGSSRMTLTGRLLPCPVYEREKHQARSRGEALPPFRCCGRYQPCQPRLNRQQEPECLHWVEGLLEQLYREGLVAVAQVSRPGQPRAHELRLQAWRLLPLLTPQQVSRFKHELDQDRHRQWLASFSHLGQLEPAIWEQTSEASLVPYLPGYEKGRTLFDVYRNNPLLKKAE